MPNSPKKIKPATNVKNVKNAKNVTNVTNVTNVKNVKNVNNVKNDTNVKNKPDYKKTSARDVNHAPTLSGQVFEDYFKASLTASLGTISSLKT